MNTRVSGPGFWVQDRPRPCRAEGRSEPQTPNPEPSGEAGFTLLELLVAIFVLAVAMAGAIGAICAAGRVSAWGRERALAADLARAALADALYAAEVYRQDNGGALSFDYNTVPADLRLGPEGYQRQQASGHYGWLWRAHSYDPASGLYSLDVWVFRDYDEVLFGNRYALDERRALFHVRTRLETRQ